MRTIPYPTQSSKWYPAILAMLISIVVIAGCSKGGQNAKDARPALGYVAWFAECGNTMETMTGGSLVFVVDSVDLEDAIAKAVEAGKSPQAASKECWEEKEKNEGSMTKNRKRKANVDESMQKLKNPPPECQKAYDSLVAAHVAFTRLHELMMEPPTKPESFKYDSKRAINQLAGKLKALKAVLP